MLKSDSKIAKYVIIHRFWSWLRNQSKKDGKWLDYENNYYLCYNQGDSNLVRDDYSNYLYLSKNRNKAAVWQWTEKPEVMEDYKREVSLI